MGCRFHSEVLWSEAMPVCSWCSALQRLLLPSPSGEDVMSLVLAHCTWNCRLCHVRNSGWSWGVYILFNHRTCGGHHFLHGVGGGNFVACKHTTLVTSSPDDWDRHEIHVDMANHPRRLHCMFLPWNLEIICVGYIVFKRWRNDCE
jgi:hypothetical protein